MYGGANFEQRAYSSSGERTRERTNLARVMCALRPCSTTATANPALARLVRYLLSAALVSAALLLFITGFSSVFSAPTSPRYYDNDHSGDNNSDTNVIRNISALINIQAACRQFALGHLKWRKESTTRDSSSAKVLSEYTRNLT